MAEMTQADRDFLASANATVQEFFAEDDWHYSIDNTEEMRTTYDMGVTMNDVRLDLRVVVNADPRSCRIEAILPVTAEKTFAYPLTEAIAKANYQLRYGVFHYDERDGEVSYRYSFPITRGVYKDDFKTCLYAVTGTASRDFEDLRKYSVGRFKRSEVSDILGKLEALVKELDD